MINLSIIVPVYNKAKYLEICIKSILVQTEKEFELILVNDGSSDNSGEICDDFKAKDNRVRVLHQRNKGVSEARNAGLALAKGKYIGFVDADDFLDRDMYETLLAYANKHDADISICGVRRVFPHREEVYGGKGFFKLYNSDEGISALFSGEILLSSYDKIYKREVFHDLRFVSTLAIFEDTYYNFEAIRKANTIVFNDAIKYNYMIRDNSHSMAAFNQKYMNTLTVTKMMVDVCQAEHPEHINESKAFDFTTNMIMLNMILISSTKRNHTHLDKVKNYLKRYNDSYKALPGIDNKYRIGYQLLCWSQALYKNVLWCYSYYTKSEHLNRKQNAAV